MVKTASMVIVFWWWMASVALAFNTVVVDAGHGGGDRGGIPGQRIAEKGVTLDTALRLKAKLEAEGMQVIMTRTQDVFLTLQERTLIANRTRGSIFVSIHFDAYPRRGANGVSTFYSNLRSGALAAAIHRRKLAMLHPQTDRGVKRARFYVIRNTVQPSVLSEGGYLTCPWEAAKILQPSYRQTLAEAIAAGVMDYRDSLGLRRPRPLLPPKPVSPPKPVAPPVAPKPPAAVAPPEVPARPMVPAPAPAPSVKPTIQLPAPPKPQSTAKPEMPVKAAAAPAPKQQISPKQPLPPPPAAPAKTSPETKSAPATKPGASSKSAQGTAPAPVVAAPPSVSPSGPPPPSVPPPPVPRFRPNASAFSKTPAHLLPSQPTSSEEVPVDLPEVDLPENPQKGPH
jgi:N-acetylmuramoyl-L-alanine amidase